MQEPSSRSPATQSAGSGPASGAGEEGGAPLLPHAAASASDASDTTGTRRGPVRRGRIVEGKCSAAGSPRTRSARPAGLEPATGGLEGPEDSAHASATCTPVHDSGGDPGDNSDQRCNESAGNGGRGTLVTMSAVRLREMLELLDQGDVASARAALLELLP